MKIFLSLFTFCFSWLPSLASDNPDINFKTRCNEKNQEATIAMVGDILIHKPLYQAVISKSLHFTQIWEKTIPLIKKADFAVGNLEGPSAIGIDRSGNDHGDVGFIYDDKIYSGTNYVFNYHPRILSDLRDSGFGLLTLANNHSTDRLSIGIDKTIEAAKSYGIKTVGIRSTADAMDSDFYKIVTIKNIRVAFLGCTEYINIPDREEQVLFCENENFFRVIKSITSRPDVDALIILTHWGVEYSSTPKDYQREYARRYLEAGALAVVGSHPHVLAPWEKYTTRNGRETMIFYSLGNFVAHQEGIKGQTGAIAYLGVSKAPNEKARIFGALYSPTYRIGTNISPIKKGEFPDIADYVSLMFGKKGRLAPEDNLKARMCSKSD